MSGWLSGGIPGLNRGGAAAPEGDPSLQQAADTTVPEPATRDPAAASTEHVKDDDASRWVAGYVTADSRTLSVSLSEVSCVYIYAAAPYTPLFYCIL